MSISYYDLAQDGEKFLSPHFQIKEFADPSDYERVPFPTTIPIHDKLPEILEKIYNNFGCTRGSITHTFAVGSLLSQGSWYQRLRIKLRW